MLITFGNFDLRFCILNARVFFVAFRNKCCAGVCLFLKKNPPIANNGTAATFTWNP